MTRGTRQNTRALPSRENQTAAKEVAPLSKKKEKVKQKPLTESEHLDVLKTMNDAEQKLMNEREVTKFKKSLPSKEAIEEAIPELVKVGLHSLIAMAWHMEDSYFMRELEVFVSGGLRVKHCSNPERITPELIHETYKLSNQGETYKSARVRNFRPESYFEASSFHPKDGWSAKRALKLEHRRLFLVITMFVEMPNKYCISKQLASLVLLAYEEGMTVNWCEIIASHLRAAMSEAGRKMSFTPWLCHIYNQKGWMTKAEQDWFGRQVALCMKGQGPRNGDRDAVGAEEEEFQNAQQDGEPKRWVQTIDGKLVEDLESDELPKNGAPAAQRELSILSQGLLTSGGLTGPSVQIQLQEPTAGGGKENSLIDLSEIPEPHNSTEELALTNAVGSRLCSPEVDNDDGHDKVDEPIVRTSRFSGQSLGIISKFSSGNFDRNQNFNPGANFREKLGVEKIQGNFSLLRNMRGTDGKEGTDGRPLEQGVGSRYIARPLVESRMIPPRSPLSSLVDGPQIERKTSVGSGQMVGTEKHDIDAFQKCRYQSSMKPSIFLDTIANSTSDFYLQLNRQWETLQILCQEFGGCPVEEVEVRVKEALTDKRTLRDSLNETRILHSVAEQKLKDAHTSLHDIHSHLEASENAAEKFQKDSKDLLDKLSKSEAENRELQKQLRAANDKLAMGQQHICEPKEPSGEQSLVERLHDLSSKLEVVVTFVSRYIEFSSYEMEVAAIKEMRVSGK